MTVDIIKIPVDEYGCFKYDIETIRNMVNDYRQIKPNQPVICIPEDIVVLQNQNIQLLINFRDQLNEIIEDAKK